MLGCMSISLHPATGQSTTAPQLEIRVLDPRASVPSYQTEHAAGLDLAACLPEGHPGLEIVPIIRGGTAVLVGTGLAVAIPEGFEGQVRPRSGLSTKHGVTMPNAPGTIDADYRGEVKVPIINLGQQAYTVRHGERIAQMIIAPVARATIRVVSELSATGRGSGGFGSTGA